MLHKLRNVSYKIHKSGRDYWWGAIMQCINTTVICGNCTVMSSNALINPL